MIPGDFYPVNLVLAVKAENKNMIAVKFFSLAGDTGKIFGLCTTYYHLAADRVAIFSDGCIHRIIDIGEAIDQGGPDSFAQFTDPPLSAISERFKKYFAIGIAKTQHFIDVALLVSKHK